MVVSAEHVGVANSGLREFWLLQVLLRSLHLDERDTSGRMPGELAAILVHLGHFQNISVDGSGLDHDNPLHARYGPGP